MIPLPDGWTWRGPLIDARIPPRNRHERRALAKQKTRALRYLARLIGRAIVRWGAAMRANYA